MKTEVGAPLGCAPHNDGASFAPDTRRRRTKLTDDKSTSRLPCWQETTWRPLSICERPAMRDKPQSWASFVCRVVECAAPTRCRPVGGPACRGA